MRIKIKSDKNLKQTKKKGTSLKINIENPLIIEKNYSSEKDCKTYICYRILFRNKFKNCMF